MSEDAKAMGITIGMIGSIQIKNRQGSVLWLKN